MPASMRAWSGSLVERDQLAVDRNGLRAWTLPRPDEGHCNQRADKQQACERIEGGLEAVVERHAARCGDGMRVNVVARRAGGDGAHGGDPDRAADLAARVDQ